MKYWNSDEVQLLQDNLGLETIEIYNKYTKAYGNARSYDSVQKQVRKLRLQFADEPVPMTPEEQNMEVFFDDYTSDAAINVKEWVTELSRMYSDLGSNTTTPVQSDKPSLVLLLSDIHFGKLTETFDLAECVRRVREIPTLLLQKPLPEFDEIVVVLAGDIVEGEDIYPTQNISIVNPVIEQVKVATETLWALLLDLVAVFRVPVKMKSCPGNHGRSSRTADTRSNWDNVIYQTLGMLGTLHGDPLLEVNANLEWFCEFHVKGKLGLAYHYGVKHTGTPAMQIKIANWIITKGIDFMVKGHHHKWEINTHLGRPVISNGSVCGPDEYSESLALDEPARQAYFLVYPDKPIDHFGFVEWR